MQNNEPANALTTLLTKFDDLCERVERIEAAVCKQYLTREDICKLYLGCSVRHAMKQGVWIWPNNAVGDIPDKYVWQRSTCEEWYAVPLQVHEAEYHREMLKRRPA